MLLQIVKFLQDNDNVNIIMLNILHRYDWYDNSYVNKEIKNLIQNFKKTAKLFNPVKILEFSSNRNISLSMVCI